MSNNNSKASLENNEKDLDSNSEKENNLERERESKYKLKNIINKNRNHSDFGHQLTYNKKLENELDTLPKDLNKFQTFT